MSGVKITNYKKVLKSLHKKQAKISDTRAYHLRALALIDSWVQENFKTEGKKAQKGGWKKLSEYTKQQRTGSPPYKILQDKGQLKSKWTEFASKQKAVITSGVDYGTQHHEGIGVPKRQILPEEKQIIDKFMKLVTLMVKEDLRA